MIHSLCPGDSGNLYIGTWGGGVDIFNPKTEKFIHIRHDPENSNSLSSDNVMVLLRDRWGLIWIGTEGGGLDCYDPQNKSFLHFKYNHADAKSLSNDFVWSLFQDKTGNLWIGTKRGLNVLNLSNLNNKDELFSSPNLIFDRFDNNPDNINDKWIVGISADWKNNIWIGSYGGGLYKFNIISRKFTNYKNDSTDKNSIGINDIKPVYIDPRGQALWVGTDGAGLYKYSFQQKQFYHLQHQVNNPNSLRPKRCLRNN